MALDQFLNFLFLGVGVSEKTSETWVIEVGDTVVSADIEKKTV